MNQSIEKFRGNESGEFSPHYTLEISLSCKNCGTFKERWMAASDGPTAFHFTLTMCEYCGCFRFEAVLHAKFFDNRDSDNLKRHKDLHERAKEIDDQARKRLEGPKVTKNVEGERID